MPFVNLFFLVEWLGLHGWLQVKAGSVFDNILICDEPEYAKKVVEEVFHNREVCPTHSFIKWTIVKSLFLTSVWYFRLKKRLLRKQRKSGKQERKRLLCRHNLILLNYSHSTVYFTELFTFNCMLCLLVLSHLSPWNVQEAQRAREEGERRRRERGYDRRRDRYRDRYRKVCALLLQKFFALNTICWKL